MSDGRVTLDIPLFAVAPEGYFHRSPAGDTVFAMRLGEARVALSLTGIRKEYRIVPDSADGRMLGLIERALDFVTLLRPGDALPAELLTGEPSWNVGPRHRLRAYQRLMLQLATWITGEERVVTGAHELDQIAEDPATKRKWNEALDEAAGRLGFARGGRDQVMALVSSLAEEIAFIESLRERFDALALIDRRADRLARLFAHEAGTRETIGAVRRLLKSAGDRYRSRFADIDAQTGAILSALEKPARQVRYIRRMRDDLYCSLAAWQPLGARWEKAPMTRAPANVTLLRETYRFLAPRFMPMMEWVQVSGRAALRKDKGTAVVW